MSVDRMRRRHPAPNNYESGAAFRGCQFCHGRGCLACPKEADKAYKREFPDGPKPLATFRTDDPEDMEKAQKVIGIDALRKAFGPGGDGMTEVVDNLRKEGKLEE